MDFDGSAATGSRYPSGVFDVGREPDPLYTLANERTYLSWLRLAITLLAAAVAIDRLFLEHPWFGSQILALALVLIGFGTCAVGVRRWWATERALRLRRPLPGCVFHTDCGSQYASEMHRGLLEQHGFVGSMSRRGNPYDNAQAESFMKTLKVEDVYLMEYETFDDVAEGVPRFHRHL